VRSLLQGQPLATCLKERSNLRAGRVVIVISIHLWSIVVKQLAKCVYRLMFLDAVVMLLGLDSCGRCGRLLEFLSEICTVPQDLKTLTSE
jgi:hypothetical protein